MKTQTKNGEIIKLVGLGVTGFVDEWRRITIAVRGTMEHFGFRWEKHINYFGTKTAKVRLVGIEGNYKKAARLAAEAFQVTDVAVTTNYVDAVQGGPIYGTQTRFDLNIYFAGRYCGPLDWESFCGKEKTGAI